tara:strand:+ start:851 stop:991 length:141 start_codon:yes stop_codon:yes gene_type:complete
MAANKYVKVKTTKVPPYVRNLDPKRYDKEPIHIKKAKTNDVNDVNA